MKVGVLNYGCGNIQSIVNALTFMDYEAVSIESPHVGDLAVDHLILPGVGSFGFAMSELKARGFVDFLEDYRADFDKKILGVCLGMQLMCSASEESPNSAGLGWFPYQVRRLKCDDVKVPHVGWNTARMNLDPTGGSTENDYYFVHSYAIPYEEGVDQVAITHHGQTFCSVLKKENMMACQFHPEKSQFSGLNLIKDFFEG